ncbi:tetratricopeptide repeat protein [Hymenobacter busanensis]|nr:tetratricopeptide repeat protein [Hymenobacter busanensis]QHJ05806.1 tetratricopeptide repeat protein [Hymenobacter busanensis]
MALALLWGTLQGQSARPSQLPSVFSRPDSVPRQPPRAALPDTARVRGYLARGKQMRYTNIDSALRFDRQALALSRRIGFREGQARAQHAVANDLYNAGSYVAAGQAYEAAVHLTRRAGLCDQEAGAYNGMGLVAQALGNVQGAIEYFNRARARYAQCKPVNPRYEVLVLTNIGNTYMQTGQPARAERPLRQALARVTPAVDAAAVLNLLDLVGMLQQHQQHLDSAVATWRHELALANRVGNRRAQSFATANLASATLAQGQPRVALAYAQQAMRLARQLGNFSQITDNTLVLARAMHALGQPAAFDTLSRFLVLQDTLMGRARTEAVAQAQARFNVAEQHARIRTLEQQRRIIELQRAQQTLRTRVAVGVGLLLLALGLGLGWWVYRRRQQRREAALRRQLAADLHDDVGTLLTQIALQTDLLQEGLASPEEQPLQWAEVAGRSRLAVRQLNDVVWGLDAQNDTVPDLLNRLRDYAHEVLVPSGRDVRFVADPPASGTPLSAAVRRQLYLIYKEALHNILKHTADTATVTVTLHRQGPLLVLEVVNDGPLVPPGTERASGHGLRNIRTRAQALGGHATAEAAPNGGFAVRVQVPLT